VNFDRIAPWYRWFEYAVFGRALERRRSALIGEVAEAKQVLVLGDGDGRALVDLLAATPRANIDCVDLSAHMLGLARARAGNARVAYRHTDALSMPLPCQTYDLVATHFFLDCLSEADMERLLVRVTPALVPSARWIVSEFRQPTVWAASLVRGMYVFFRITAGLRTMGLADHRPIFARHGFRPIRMQTAWGGLMVSELWEREGVGVFP